MDRRVACVAVVGSLLSQGAWAQGDTRVRRIGYLSLRSDAGPLDKVFFDALRSLGYVEGQNLAVEYRWAGDDEGALPRLAGELARRDVEVIVTAATPAVSAAARATRTIPIVMQAAADPVSSGLVKSLANPGGNVTGMTILSSELTAKRLQLLSELVPDITRVAVMAVDNRFATPLLLQAVREAASALGVATVAQLVRTDDDVRRAFATFASARASVVLVQASPFVASRLRRVAELAADHRLPAMYEAQNYVEAGGLVAYGPDVAQVFERAAGFVDRILKGASPANLPVEQPTKFELAINLKTARTLSLNVPRSLLLRADRLIE